MCLLATKHSLEGVCFVFLKGRCESLRLGLHAARGLAAEEEVGKIAGSG